MALKFQYNKTARQQLEKQLKIRVRALPTLKNKESALRVEVKKAKDQADALQKSFNDKKHALSGMMGMWEEFDTSLIDIKEVHFSIKKIAGVKTPVLNGIDFEIKEFSVFNKPKWYFGGVQVVKELAKLAIERDFFIRKMELLDRARKKTTQKVNLFEKVQIPEYEDAIRKIKRFLEDEENLSKSAQKIVKDRQQKQEEVQA